MSHDLESEQSVAMEALTRALAIAQSRFGTFLDSAVKDATGDIVTDVDRLCEEEIAKVIRDSYPEHALILEESGSDERSSLWTWVVDPLDGTNNYAYGLPLWGMSVTLCHRQLPVLTCIAEGYTGNVITVSRGQEVRINDIPWRRPEGHPVIPSGAFWIGYDVDRNAASTLNLLDVLSRNTRRVFQNWAPTVDAGLYLRGGVDIIIGKGCAGTELPAVLLILREAGAVIVDLNGAEVSLDRVPDVFVAGRGDVVRGILPSLQGSFAMF